MNISELKEIYNQVKVKTQEYNQFMEDSNERVSESEVLSFNSYLYDGSMAVQVTTKFYNKLEKQKMNNVRGYISAYGNIHVSFNYEGMEMVTCFLPEEVSKNVKSA